MVSSSHAALKPINGEKSRVWPILVAWAQSTPLVPEALAAISWFMRPTPMMEPIRVCELDDGSPKYQVPKFHKMAAINNANTIANPAPLLTCRINSTGSRETMPNATAPVDSSTPKKLNVPDQMTARLGAIEFV